MGLLWSLEPAGWEDRCLSQMLRDMMKTLLKVEVTVHQAPQQLAVPLGPALVLQAGAAPLLAANPPPAGRLPAAPRCMGPFPQRTLHWL